MDRWEEATGLRFYQTNIKVEKKMRWILLLSFSCAWSNVCRALRRLNRSTCALSAGKREKKSKPLHKCLSHLATLDDRVHMTCSSEGSQEKKRSRLGRHSIYHNGRNERTHRERERETERERERETSCRERDINPMQPNKTWPAVHKASLLFHEKKSKQQSLTIPWLHRCIDNCALSRLTVSHRWMVQSSCSSHTTWVLVKKKQQQKKKSSEVNTTHDRCKRHPRCQSGRCYALKGTLWRTPFRSWKVYNTYQVWGASSFIVEYPSNPGMLPNLFGTDDFFDI